MAVYVKSYEKGDDKKRPRFYVDVSNSTRVFFDATKQGWHIEKADPTTTVTRARLALNDFKQLEICSLELYKLKQKLE